MLKKSTMKLIKLLHKSNKVKIDITADDSSSYQYDFADENTVSPFAVVYQSELDYISRCILDYPNLETGGQLFGFWTNSGTPVVAYAIGPGIDARHNSTSFYQDAKYMISVGKYLGKQFGLQHIGEWHSHHQLTLSHPSGGDVLSMQSGLFTPGFPRMLLCIGNCFSGVTEINAFNFHRSSPKEYYHAKWDIIGIESPYRPLIDYNLRNKLIHPHTVRACHGEFYSCAEFSDDEQIIDRKIHWLTQKEENVQIMKEFLEIIRQVVLGKDVKILINENGIPYISIESGEMEIIFPYDFPKISPQFKKNGIILTPEIEWKVEHKNLVRDFEIWVNKCFSIDANQTTLTTNTSQDSEASLLEDVPAKEN